MSLDLYAFAPRPGEDPGATIEALELEDDLSGRPDPVAAARNDRIIVALSAAHPAARELRSARSMSLVDDALEIYLSRQYAVISVDYQRARVWLWPSRPSTAPPPSCRSSRCRCRLL